MDINMLGISRYTQAYIDDCRARIDLQLSAYHEFLLAADTGEDKAALGAAKDAFEAPFFRHLILAMDHYFDNRLRTLELKDGNPANEVRVLCNSIMHNSHKLLKDSQIKLDPAKSVLGLKVGDDIRLTTHDFKRLADAFFNEISVKYAAA
jgi:hypothetical protein